MQKGDFVRISYVGRIKENGEVFDKAERVPIVAGEGFVIPGLDDVILSMNVGEKRIVEIPPEKAFGNRNPKLVKLLPLSEFKKHGMNPYPGMVVRADNIYGRVLSVDSGRVRVDFNHPLAGKILEYEIEINEKIEKNEEKVRALLEFFTGIKQAEVRLSEGVAEIKVRQQVSEPSKSRLSSAIKQYLGVREVVISEVF